MHRTRRVAALALVATAVLGVSVASAATLDVRGGVLQAGSAVVGSCQPAGQPVRVSLTSAPTPTGYATSQVVLAGVAPACDGLAFGLEVLSPAGTPVDLDAGGPGTGVAGTVRLSGGVLVVQLPAGTVPTTQIGRVAVLVHG